MNYDQAITVYLAQNSKPASVLSATAQWWRKLTAFFQAQELELNKLRPCHLERFQQALHWEPQSHMRTWSASASGSAICF